MTREELRFLVSIVNRAAMNIAEVEYVNGIFARADVALQRIEREDAVLRGIEHSKEEEG